MDPLERRFPDVLFYNARLTEVQDGVAIGAATRIGSLTLVQKGAVIGSDCPHVTAEQDGFGNVIACYRHGSGEARYAFAAHMDHPAYVGEELEALHKLYGGTVFENQQFTVAGMEKDLGETPYQIVHIASHGQFDSDPNKTFLLTYDGRLGMNKLEQILGLSRFRTDAVELLTLSACQTAAGDDRAALGLAGVAIKAGARSALATLWTVNDPASAQLVVDFYRALLDPAVSKAKALQQAQLELLKDARYRHPSYWSAFLLIGNWL